MQAARGDTVGFVEIDEFKDLENDIVMVADLPAQRSCERDCLSQCLAEFAIQCSARSPNAQRFALGVDRDRI